MDFEQPKMLGVVNITADSFSDGGRFLDPEKAIARALELVEAGAHAIDLGAASSHPDSKPVSAEEQIRRLTPVAEALLERGVCISVDTYLPEVQTHVMQTWGIRYLNDIQGFPNAEIYPALADFPGKLILMHSVQRYGPATRVQISSKTILDEIEDFFMERLGLLEDAGIHREKIILDPGMGFFLGTDQEASLVVLRNLGELKKIFGLPLLVSVSRKSFLGAITGREVRERGAATLMAELYAISKGADYIRTHDVQALRDALEVQRALDGVGNAEI